MELYLIRHGIAQEREPGLNDGDRRLTRKGKGKTTQIAQRLQQMGIEFDLILSSPLVRAHETAQIFLEQGLSPRREIFDALGPGHDHHHGLTQLMEQYQHRSRRCMALVGHQPDLGSWAEFLVYGSVQGKLIVKKAGIIGIVLPGLTAQPGQGDLFLLTPPRWLL